MKHLQGYSNQQKSVFGKVSDDHAATFDFKFYEGDTDTGGRAHGEGRYYSVGYFHPYKSRRDVHELFTFRIVYRNGDTFVGSLVEGKRQGRGLLKYGDHSKLRL